LSITISSFKAPSKTPSSRQTSQVTGEAKTTNRKTKTTIRKTTGKAKTTIRKATTSCPQTMSATFKATGSS
jgi:hypothetical protein